MAIITLEQAGHRNLIAFLDMLAHSEGTDNGRQPTNCNGYDVLVGGQLFTSFADHPRILVKLSRTLSSTAAGRYQLLGRYWDHYKKQLGLRDFSPLSQDLVAIQQIKEQKALTPIFNGDFAKAVLLTRNIWASLPGAGYGQHENKITDLAAVYELKGGVLA